MSNINRDTCHIHPTALVSPDARIGENVSIGPFCVVEENVEIGDHSILEAFVSIRRGTILGKGNHVFENAVLGAPPQHAHPPERPGNVTIGDNNVIREACTIHKATDENIFTQVGSNNLLMVNVHVAHDCILGSGIVVANNTSFAGHVLVEDRAVISAEVAVHQFCRIGSFAMVGGKTRVTKDIPPCVLIDGLSSFVVGLNKVGLRRAGISAEEMIELKKAYRMLYRSGLLWNELVTEFCKTFTQGLAAHMGEFIANTRRGIVPERRTPPGATIRLVQEDDDAPKGSVSGGSELSHSRTDSQANLADDVNAYRVQIG